MTTRLEQKEQRRGQILEAALDQFIRRGYAGAKIKDIADASQMSAGLLFHYFESKEALYTELIRLGVSGPEWMIGGIGQAEPLAFFERCADTVLRLAAQSLFTAKMFVLMGSAYYTEDIPEQARALAITTNFYRQMVPLVQAGQQSGTIRKGDPLALCMCFWTALQGCIGAYALDPTLPLPEAAWIVDIIRAQKGEGEGEEE